ncbi:hypothetical protein SK128_024085 [Halocaridina rubra]|uniref:Uncharacterized protein n=1 Tax=Halocaridina rubra TaxID=373956 RepID=A0AAN9A8Q3_HALRR
MKFLNIRRIEQMLLVTDSYHPNRLGYYNRQKSANQRENIKMKPSLSQTSPTHGSGEGVVIRGLKQRIKKLEEMVISLDDKIRNMDGEMKENETLREQIRSLEEANKAQGQERKELEKRIKKLEGEKSQLESRISKQEDKNKQLNDNLKELDVSSLLSSERDEIAAWNVQIKENIEQFRKEFQELTMENDAMKTSFADALKGNVAVKEAVKGNRTRMKVTDSCRPNRYNCMQKSAYYSPASISEHLSRRSCIKLLQIIRGAEVHTGVWKFWGVNLERKFGERDPKAFL